MPKIDPNKVDRPRDADADARLRELMLYIAQKTEGDPSFGSIKLNKALFFADLEAFGKFGKSITGATYQKLEHGPAPRRLLPVRKQMLDNEDAVMVSREVRPGYPVKRLVARRDPRLELFTGPQIALVDELLGAMEGLTGRRVSEISHDYLDCWDALPVNETIPMEVVFVNNRKLTLGERQHGLHVEATIGR